MIKHPPLTPEEKQRRADAGELVAVVLAAYPATSARIDTIRTEAMIKAYASQLLEDLPYAQVNAAIGALVQTSKFMPSIAEIRAAALELVRGQVRAGGDAWGDVLAAIRRYGSHRTPGVDFAFDDPLVAKAVRAFGWFDLCASENAVADRARFVELYDKLAAQEQREAVSPVLAGAAQARANALVGNVARALAAPKASGGRS